MKTKCMKYYHKVDKIIAHDNNSKRVNKRLSGKKNKIAVIAWHLEFSVDEEEVNQ